MNFLHSYRTQNANSKGFIVQYVSLVLIVMTVFAGAVSKPLAPDAQSLRQALSSLVAISDWQEVVLINDDTSKIEQLAQFHAERAIVGAHDVVLELEISAPSLPRALALVDELKEILPAPSNRSDAVRYSLQVDASLSASLIKERWYHVPVAVSSEESP